MISKTHVLFSFMWCVTVALVAADTVFTMEKHNSRFEELLEDNLLPLAVTRSPLLTFTHHPLHSAHAMSPARPPIKVNPHQALLEEDDLLPTDFNGELFRERRAAPGSGYIDTEVVASVTLNEPSVVALNDQTARKLAVEASLKELFSKLGVSVQNVTVLNMIDDAGQTKYNFTVTFSGSTDRRGTAYALERMWRGESQIGGYTIAKSPSVTNSADVVVNAICLCCPVARPCTSEGVCATFSIASSSAAVPYGLGEADIRLEHRDEVVSAVINGPDGGLPISSSRVDSLYVGDNGGVSLGVAYNPYNLIKIKDALVNYICIYCDDFDNRYTSGDVWYQTYPAGKWYATNMLDRLTAEVRAHSEYSSFSASWALVATWYNIPAYEIFSTIGSQGNTFQMVIVTDGQRTFTLFYFVDMKAGVHFREQGVHGYKLSASDVYSMLYSRKSITSRHEHFDKPKMNTVKGNTDIVGKWIFKIGEIVTPNYAAKCFNWYLQNFPLRSYFRNRASVLQTNRCPCRRSVLFWTAAFLPTPAFTNQAVFCSENKAWFGIDSYSCCYDAVGRFIRDYPSAGGYERYSNTLDPLRHKLQDSDPRDWCCSRSNLCFLYEDVRPVSRCFNNRPIIIFIYNVGDPHYTSLDNKVFTFNGIGEYRLTELTPTDNSFTFKSQCRTTQATTSAGTKVKASVFAAFAMEQKSNTLGNAKVHVGMNADKTRLEIYFNDVDITADFYKEANYVKRLDFFTLSKKSDTNVEIAFTKIGITVSVKMTSGTLAQAVIIPETYKGLTKGLLGNYNGNANDDFVSPSPSRTTYSADSTDRQLFPFGKSWAVTDQSSSILSYAPGKTTTTFTDNSFVPMYTDEISAADRALAAQICGASKEQCIYDYVVTKNRDLALATTTQLEEAKNVNTVLANRAPVVVGTTQINAEVGKSVDLKFVGTDADSDTISYIAVESPTTGFMFDQTAGTGQFTPTDANPVKIRVAAKDSKNAESAVLDVQVRLCKGCGSNGNCDYSTPVSTITSQADSLFQVVTCACNTGYTGADCTQDKNGCEGNPCGTARTCTDNTPAVEAAVNGKAFTCSVCQAGYQEVAGSTNNKCENINECSANSGQGDCPANSVCADTPGSYTCTCKAGNRKNSAGLCIDIDECVEHLTPCTQTCKNTEGSFTCTCYDGYTLNADSKTCDASTLPAACTPTPCDANAVCANASGAAVCECKAGYEKKAGASTCTDIDECSRNLCAQKCTNTVGSFTCSCFTGYLLGPDKLDCLRCSFPNWGEGCTSVCECQGRATACDPVKGCLCNAGWTGANCGTNVNECGVNPAICGNNMECKDTPGSYTCDCPTGYVKNGTECKDVNECEVDSTTAVCPANSVCVNEVGTYTCNCNSGYRKSGAVCEDINECVTNKDGCQQNCLNQDGGFNCYCFSGYSLNDDRKTCSKETTSPCDGLTNLKCAHYCQLVSGQPKCMCNRGYYLAGDQVTCPDVNECTNASLNLCSKTDSCTNTGGSYTCSCSDGQRLKSDGRTCIDCDSTHWGPNCANSCECSPLGGASCDKIKGCVCKSGWTGTKCDIDIDECAPKTCQANADCKNLPGTYQCACRTGYTASGATCTNVNECSGSNVCDHNCQDTTGSYYCSCRPGFILEGKGTCTDVDECTKGSHDCQQTCRNTAGSFTCECYSGFTLSSDRKACTDTNECLSTTLNTCSYQCNNIPGSFTCSCPAGYLGSVNTCTANFFSYIIIIVLNFDRSAIISAPSSAAYVKLQQDIAIGVDEIIMPLIGNVHLKTSVKTLTVGSVVAPSELRMDKSKTDNELGLLAKSLEKLAELRVLNVAGSPIQITNITYKGIPILKEHTECDVLRLIRTFSSTEYCELDASGTPIARGLNTSADQTPLIVGLSVASVIVAILLLAFLAYMCCFRRRTTKSPSEERDNTAFRSAFVGNLPTKSNFAASRYMMYSPHTLSDAGSQASDDSFEKRQHRKYGGPNFNDMPAWTEDRSPGFTHNTRGNGARGTGPGSNFSWEHLFDRLEPSRNGAFEVPRPAVRHAPNKFYDSLA